MKTILQRKRFLYRAAVFCALLCVFSLPQASLAHERVDTTKTASLTIDCRYNATALPGSVFRLYKVADISEAARYTLTDQFSVYKDTVTGLDDLNGIADTEAWANLASTLAAYASADDLTPVVEAVSNGEGTISFRNLHLGLYLAAGEKLTQGKYTYTFTPYLISLPNADASADEWMYDVTSEAKVQRISSEGSSSDVSRKAVKVWKDSSSEARPKAVTVQLLCDGSVYSEATLNTDNNWTYTWSRLASGHTWTIVEKSVSDGYTVSIFQSGTTFILTNTEKPSNDPDDPTVPDDPSNPTNPGNPNDPDNPINFGDPEGPGKTPEDSNISRTNGGSPDRIKLPQTGQLNWPIPVMVIAGLGLFSAGFRLRFGKREEPNETER